VSIEDRRRFFKRLAVIAGLALSPSAIGCSYLQQARFLIPSIPLDKKTQLSNPVTVSVNDSEFLWNQIVDTVEDYFKIKSEQRASRDPSGWLEGRMETYPEIGATFLEPWRKDAAFGYVLRESDPGRTRLFGCRRGDQRARRCGSFTVFFRRFCDSTARWHSRSSHPRLIGSTDHFRLDSSGERHGARTAYTEGDCGPDDQCQSSAPRSENL